MTITAGCTSTGVIDRNQATIDANSSVIAFSVNTGTLSEYKMPIRAAQLHIQYGGESVPIRLSEGKAGLQRILLEVPAQAVLFSQFELTAGNGIFSHHYRTSDSQRVELTQGEITYLGRIGIEKVIFEEHEDGSLGKPSAVKLVFADAHEDDQFAWEQEYKLFQNRVPNQQIVGNWAGRDYLNVWRRDWTIIYGQRNRSRSGNSGGSPMWRPTNNSPPRRSGHRNRSPRN